LHPLQKEETDTRNTRQTIPRQPKHNKKNAPRQVFEHEDAGEERRVEVGAEENSDSEQVRERDRRRLQRGGAEVRRGGDRRGDRGGADGQLVGDGGLEHRAFKVFGGRRGRGGHTACPALRGAGDGGARRRRRHGRERARRGGRAASGAAADDEGGWRAGVGEVHDRL